MMRTFLDRLEKVIDLLGAAALIALIIVAFLQVICRFFLHNALNWPEEVCRYLFIIVAYLGAVVTMKRDKHLRVDILLSFSGPLMKRVFNIITYLGSLAYCVICCGASWMLMLEIKSMDQMAASIPLPVWITWVPIPICFALMALYALARLYVLCFPEKSISPND